MQPLPARERPGPGAQSKLNHRQQVRRSRPGARSSSLCFGDVRCFESVYTGCREGGRRGGSEGEVSALAVPASGPGAWVGAAVPGGWFTSQVHSAWERLCGLARGC